MTRLPANGQPSLVCVVGARPNYMKMAPVMAALRRQGRFRPVLVHTGQHYDPEMNDQFFRELALPAADRNLGVGSASHAVQTAEVMKGFEPVLDETPDPAAVVVVGDVNSTIACSLVAAKKGVPVVHIEAGLRSFDRAMPEEINRVLTDQISTLLLTTERNAAANLEREGIAAERVHFVGNLMIDSVFAHLERATPPEATFAAAGAPAFGADGYALLTLHRPSNVDDAAVLGGLLGAVARIAERLPVVFPVHPRTRARIAAAGLDHLLPSGAVLLLPPAGYLAMLGLMRSARLILTDSGGIQEETTALGVPCLTLRHNTERPITVEEGTNTLVGTDPERIVAAAADVLRTGGKRGRRPELWDGRAAERVVDVLARAFLPD
jgi:UDP-N-acetylglucosamine 2-epimerase (non-hydrolysing)